jgi:glycerol-3-phosphate dehydrogenase
MGPWAHEIFDASGIAPKYLGVNNKGAHIIVEDMGLKAGLFLQSPEDGRIFFVLPWQGKTLIGTTETEFDQSPDTLITNASDVSYILDHCNRYFTRKIAERDIIGTFSGLRWLAKDAGSGLSETSRSHLISEHRIGPGCIYTIYGGKLTAYRALSEEIGDMIVRSFGEEAPSKTAAPESWIAPEKDSGLIAVPQRFAGM